MSYAGLGQVIPSATVGRDSSRYESGGAVRVSARWAQRAVNAGNRYNSGSAPLIAVDGKAGPITIAGLRALSRQFASDQPVTNDPPTSRVTDRVIIPVALETALAARNFVPDPPVSSATRRSTSSTSTSAPVTESIPGATPAATPADEVILDEGSSAGWGLIARYGIWPWVAGGTALVGVGIWFLLGGGTGASMRANRRRRVKRNDGGGYELVYQTGGHGGPYETQASAERSAESMLAGGRDKWIAIVPSAEIVDLNQARPVATLFRDIGWIRGRTWLPSARVARNRHRRVRRNTGRRSSKKYATHRTTGKYIVQRGAAHPCPACGGDIGAAGSHSQRCPLGPKRRPTPGVRRNTGKQTWVWDWTDGGWNSALASSKAEATRIAKAMGKPTPGGGMKVTLTPTRVRPAAPGEIKNLSAGWD